MPDEPLAIMVRRLVAELVRDAVKVESLRRDGAQYEKMCQKFGEMTRTLEVQAKRTDSMLEEAFWNIQRIRELLEPEQKDEEQVDAG